jgi:hypothetical protein
MVVASGPVRYLYLRGEGPLGAGDLKDWPPPDTQRGEDDATCVAVRMLAAEDGWHVEALEQVPAEAEIPEDALVMSHATELGFTAGRPDAAVALLGVRVEEAEPKAAQRLTHLVVYGQSGGARTARPVVIPAAAIVVTNYAERSGRTEATLDLRMAPGELNACAPWLPDASIEGLAVRAVDDAVLSPRARHGITIEVHAGRVALYGRTEIASNADAAIAQLEETPGVVDVANYLLIDEDLQGAVEQALAEKGISGVRALAEHGLISLHGQTPDAATRRKAQDIATRVTGVRGVVNRIELPAPQ